LLYYRVIIVSHFVKKVKIFLWKRDIFVEKYFKFSAQAPKEKLSCEKMSLLMRATKKIKKQWLGAARRSAVFLMKISAF
jgi:hypothetical protein